MSIKDRIKKNELEFGRPWIEILEMFNEPDYMNSILSIYCRAEILGFSYNFLWKEYRRRGIKVRHESNPKIFDLKDKIWVKTELSAEEFFKVYRKFSTWKEIGDFLELPYYKLDYFAHTTHKFETYRRRYD